MLMKDQCAAHRSINIELLQVKALQLAGEKIVAATAFKASRHWAHRFICSVRTVVCEDVVMQTMSRFI